MQGVVVGGFPKEVPHLLGYAPLVIPNLISTKATSGGFNYVRPYDNTFPPYTYSYVKSEIGKITFYQSGVLLDINYFMINKQRP